MSEPNGLLTADNFFAGKTERRFATVALPDGTTCRLRSMSERERTGWSQAVFDQNYVMRPHGWIALICLCLCDGDGELLFGDYRDVLEQFMDTDASVVRAMQAECVKLNRLVGLADDGEGDVAEDGADPFSLDPVIVSSSA